MSFIKDNPELAELLVKCIFNGSNSNHVPIGAEQFLGKVCVVRTYSAGVHIGLIDSIDGTNVVVKNCRRLWKWNGAFTLSEVASNGIEPKESRIAKELPIILLTEAIELIPATEVALKSFDLCHE